MKEGLGSDPDLHSATALKAATVLKVGNKKKTPNPED